MDTYIPSLLDLLPTLPLSFLIFVFIFCRQIPRYEITGWYDRNILIICLLLDVYYLMLHHSFVATAAAAKSLQSCPTLGDPIDGSPPGSPVPGILQERTLEWVGLEMVKFDKDKRLDLFSFITTAFWVAVSEKTHE